MWWWSARGRAMTREYCEEKRLPYRELGKLVVALDGGDIADAGYLRAVDLTSGRPRFARGDLKAFQALGAGDGELEPAVGPVARARGRTRLHAEVRGEHLTDARPAVSGKPGEWVWPEKWDACQSRQQRHRRVHHREFCHK